MEDMKAQIELKLIAAQLSDWCAHKDGVIFKSSLCTQERILRFQTPLLCDVIPNAESQTGAWKSGRFIMYEIYNGADEFKITCSVSLMGLLKRQRKDCLRLLECAGVTDEASKGIYFLREWNYPETARKLDRIMEAIRDFSEFELPYFETELAKWKENHNYMIKAFPDVNQEALTEGGMKDILTNKYERNMAARKKCIAVHGSACKICGFDFGAVYGAEFSGKIEVHHIVPLNEIKEEYVVDPVNDLIPVCPNCHMILHSRKDGVYTPDEIRDLLGK